MGYRGSAAMQRIKNSVIRRNPSPCKDCAKRHPGCHSECNLYSDWQKGINEKRPIFSQIIPLQIVAHKKPGKDTTLASFVNGILVGKDRDDRKNVS